jgi:exosortase A-associated hydrolase 1
MGAPMRRLIKFPCEGETLVGTLDEASSKTGVLIVSGGNELRIGAHRGMASLAQRLAAAGVPVLRFDRRGIGDSTGKNHGYESSVPDITAAVAAFRTEGVERIVGFGNCDAATALALHGAGIDALVLANPWVGDQADALPPAAAIRSRYVERLKDPRALVRLFTGGVDLGKLAKGLRKTLAPRSETGTGAKIAAGLATFSGPVTILLANRDNTAVAFRGAWKHGMTERVTIYELDSASHSFAGPTNADWLFKRLSDATQP